MIFFIFHIILPTFIFHIWLQIPGPPPNGEIIEHQKKIGLWGVTLASADATLVGRTLSTLTESPHGLPGLNESAEMVEKRKAYWTSVKPAHFGVKIGSKSFWLKCMYYIFQHSEIQK